MFDSIKPIILIKHCKFEASKSFLYYNAQGQTQSDVLSKTIEETSRKKLNTTLSYFCESIYKYIPIYKI